MTKALRRASWSVLVGTGLLLLGAVPVTAQPGTECWDCIEWGGCFFCQGQVEWGWDDCATPSCGHCSLGAFCTVGLASTLTADGSIPIPPELLATVHQKIGSQLIDLNADGKAEFEHVETLGASYVIQVCNDAVVWRASTPGGDRHIRDRTRSLVL